ncbi:MAG: IS110 family transposase [Victivallales bacterium]
MQRKVNHASARNQAENLVTVGIDMGSDLWGMGVNRWDTGKSSYHKCEGKTKDEEAYRKIGELVKGGNRVVVYYEAGRNGFTPAREIRKRGAEAGVIAVSRLEILDNGKKVKTDRVDAKFLAGLHPSDNLPLVWIPSEEEEQRRMAVREAERIGEDIRRNNNRIISLLERWMPGVEKKHKSSAEWDLRIKEWAARGVMKRVPLELERLRNMVRELEVLEKNFERWEEMQSMKEEEQKKEIRGDGKISAIEILSQYRGINGSARKISWELGDMGRFKNGRKLSSYLGLTPTPWASGKMRREQGISKKGRGELRALAIELAWNWVRWQPDCVIVKKWKDRLDVKGRSRRVAIVALARQLMVVFFRRVVFGEEIKGAIISRPLKCGC